MSTAIPHEEYLDMMGLGRSHGRKFVSLHGLDGTLYAMASDSTVWYYGKATGQWLNLGGVPQPPINDIAHASLTLRGPVEPGPVTRPDVLKDQKGGALSRDLADPPFQAFPKIPRYSRDAIVTEKIDGTLGLVYISKDGQVFAGSKSRWLDPETKGGDNHGFGMWVFDRAHQLLSLGPGYHFGEFWGSGIQRGYGLPAGEKRFSLFNVSRWAMGGKDEAARPACCDVVPILWQGSFDDIDDGIAQSVSSLREFGSAVVRGFRDPEGIVIYHVAGNVLFKKTLAHDDKPKGLA